MHRNRWGKMGNEQKQRRPCGLCRIYFIHGLCWPITLLRHPRIDGITDTNCGETMRGSWRCGSALSLGCVLIAAATQAQPPAALHGPIPDLVIPPSWPVLLPIPPLEKL